MERGFEDNLGQALYQHNSEKSFTDKLTAKDEIKEIKELIEKEDLKEDDLRRLIYLLNANEIKLVNLGEKERYILGKYATWIHEVVELQLLNIRHRKIITKKDENLEEGEAPFTDLTKECYKQNYQLLDEKVKTMCGLYLYISRSSLSLGATAFDTLTKQKYEYEYNQLPQASGPDTQSVFNIKGGNR